MCFKCPLFRGFTVYAHLNHIQTNKFYPLSYCRFSIDCPTHVVNPAVMAAEKLINVVQGSTAELEVYISGYPIPTSSHITWYYPNNSEIIAMDAGVEFQDGGRRVILSNVHPHQAGLYRCDVILNTAPYMGATSIIQLNVSDYNSESMLVAMLLPGQKVLFKSMILNFRREGWKFECWVGKSCDESTGWEHA